MPARNRESARPLITVELDNTTQDAARIMLNHKIGTLPVVKEDKLVGLLTANDLAGLL